MAVMRLPPSWDGHLQPEDTSTPLDLVSVGHGGTQWVLSCATRKAAEDSLWTLNFSSGWKWDSSTDLSTSERISYLVCLRAHPTLIKGITTFIQTSTQARMWFPNSSLGSLFGGSSSGAWLPLTCEWSSFLWEGLFTKCAASSAERWRRHPASQLNQPNEPWGEVSEVTCHRSLSHLSNSCFWPWRYTASIVSL